MMKIKAANGEEELVSGGQPKTSPCYHPHLIARADIKLSDARKC